MRRRDFITVLTGATAWVAAARAQEPRWVIGILSSITSKLLPADIQEKVDAGVVPASAAAFRLRRPTR